MATGTRDEAEAEWIESNAKQRDRRELIAWNNEMCSKRLSEMPIELQEFLEGYVPKNIPRDRAVYVWFDVYDIEEGRIYSDRKKFSKNQSPLVLSLIHI